MAAGAPAPGRTLASFVRFVAVGGVIGVISTVAIWAAGQMMPLTSWSYGLVVVCVYLAGAVTAFIGHARISFGVKVPISRFANHLVLSGSMALITAALSAGIRSVLPTMVAGMVVAPGVRDAAAFVMAALASSVLSFGLSRLFVFKVAAAPQD